MKAIQEAEPFRVKGAGNQEGGVLFTAPEAAPQEEVLLRFLEGLAPGTVLPVDFGAVLISSEAARQLLRRALRRLSSGELEDRFLVLERLGASHYNVGLMLEGEGLIAVERTDDGESNLIGRVEPAVRQTYEYLVGRDVTTARELQDHFGLGNISTATNRLTTLAKLGVARRVGEESVARGGRQYLYTAVR